MICGLQGTLEWVHMDAGVGRRGTCYGVIKGDIAAGLRSSVFIESLRG